MDFANLSAIIKSFKSGYDVPVFAIGTGHFYAIHSIAISFITASLCCVLTTLVLSFGRQSFKTFSKWAKSERFVVYLALCDGCFNLAHFCDHLQYLISKSHPYPKELCKTYAFIQAVFITAQNLLVNCVAVNAFVLIQYGRKLYLGRNDYRLLLWTFGFPLLASGIAALTDQFGPNGISCYFDIIKGQYSIIFFTTVCSSLVLVVNIILYTLTWIKINKETKQLRKQLGNMNQLAQANNKSARNMSLFVLAFFVQWLVIGLIGILFMIRPDEAQKNFLKAEGLPLIATYLVTMFTNSGGILNLIVYCVIRKRKLLQYLQTQPSPTFTNATSRKSGDKLHTNTLNSNLA